MSYIAIVYVHFRPLSRVKTFTYSVTPSCGAELRHVQHAGRCDDPTVRMRPIA